MCCCSLSGEQMDSRSFKSLSRGMEIGLWVRGARGCRRLSTTSSFPDVPSSPIIASMPFLWSDMEATDSDSGILVFLRPFAGALAVRRKRWSLNERFRGPPEFVSTEYLEERLNKPRMPRSWWPWVHNRQDRKKIYIKSSNQQKGKICGTSCSCFSWISSYMCTYQQEQDET